MKAPLPIASEPLTADVELAALIERLRSARASAGSAFTTLRNATVEKVIGTLSSITNNAAARNDEQGTPQVSDGHQKVENPSGFQDGSMAQSATAGGQVGESPALYLAANPPQTDDLTREIAEAVEKVRPLFPVSCRDTPDYAELTFGEHQTQAMTLNPQTWLALNDLFEALAKLKASPPSNTQSGDLTREDFEARAEARHQERMEALRGLVDLANAKPEASPPSNKPPTVPLDEQGAQGLWDQQIAFCGCQGLPPGEYRKCRDQAAIRAIIQASKGEGA